MTNPPPSDENATLRTKDRILDAAEQLFGDAGYASTSLRAVTGLAEVNLAAVHYHFGSKIGLFEAVFSRRVTAVNEERLARLSTLQAPDQPAHSLEDVLLAFLEPAFCQANNQDPTWPRFQRFIGRVMSEPGEHTEAVREVFRGVQMRFIPAFRALLPHLDERDVFWRIHFIAGTMCNILSDPARIGVLSEGRCDGTNPQETLPELIAFAAGGLRAASLSATAQPASSIEPGVNS